MISRSHALRQPSPPSTFKRYIDQQAVPAAVDAAAGVEAALESISRYTRRRPFAALALAFGAAFVLSARAMRRS